MSSKLEARSVKVLGNQEPRGDIPPRGESHMIIKRSGILLVPFRDEKSGFGTFSGSFLGKKSDRG